MRRGGLLSSDQLHRAPAPAPALRLVKLRGKVASLLRAGPEVFLETYIISSIYLLFRINFLYLTLALASYGGGVLRVLVLQLQ